MSIQIVEKLAKQTLALILAGGRGSRLKNLTDWQSKPAVPFGGKFRIIDFTLSNCLNSGIRRIGVLTQYKAHSLLLHCQKGWNFLRADMGEFVELLPAQQRVSEDSWYIGTADAVFQNIDILRNHAPEYVLILAGDHVYKMDYEVMIRRHVDSGADITIGCIEAPAAQARAFGVMAVDENLRVIEFQEKPEAPKTIPGRDDLVLASMGIYIFNRDFLFEQLIRDKDTPNSNHDFGKDIIPHVIEANYKVMAYRFETEITDPADKTKKKVVPAYWRDVGTLDAYWEANQELVEVVPDLNLYDRKWPIWTYQEQLPPAKFVFNQPQWCGRAVDSMVSGGCIISGSYVSHSLLFSNVRVHSHAEVYDSVILPGADIGERCLIRRAIIGEGVRIPAGMRIGETAEMDRARGFVVSESGVVLVTADMLGQNNNYVR